MANFITLPLEFLLTVGDLLSIDNIKSPVQTNKHLHYSFIYYLYLRECKGDASGGYPLQWAMYQDKPDVVRQLARLRFLKAELTHNILLNCCYNMELTQIDPMSKGKPHAISYGGLVGV